MLETKKFELEETFDKEIYIKGVQALKAQVDELNAELPDGFTVYVNVEEDAYDDMDIADEDFITVEIWCDEIAEYNDLYTGLLDVCEIRDDGTSDFDIEGILAYFDELGIFDEEEINESESKSITESSNALTRALHITGGVDSRTEAASVLHDIQRNCGIKSENEVTDILIYGKKKALALCIPSSDLAKVTKYANKKYPTLEFDIAFDFDIARLTESKSIKEGIHRIYVNGELKDEIESSNPVHEVDPIAYKYKKLNGVKEVRIEYADGTTNTMQVESFDESKSIKEGAFSGGYAGDNSFSGGTVRGIGASTQPDHKTYLNRIKAKNPKLVDIITIKAKDLKPNMMTQAGQIKTAEVKYSDYHSKDMVYVMHTNGWDYFKELDADIEVMADPDNKSNPFTGNYKDLLKMGLQESVTRTSRKHIKGFGFTAESLAERFTGK